MFVQIIINLIYVRRLDLLFKNFSKAESILKNLIDNLIQQNYLINNNNVLSLNCFDQSQLNSFLEQLVKYVSYFIVNNLPEDLLKDIEIDTNDNGVTVESITNFLNRVRKISKNDLVEFVKLDNQIVIDWILRMDPETPIKLEREYILINDDPTTNNLIIKAINQLAQLSEEYIA